MSSDSIAQLASEIWDSVSCYFSSADVQNASDSFVSVLIDSHEVEPEELRTYFSDYNITQSLNLYIPDLDAIDKDGDYEYNDDDDYDYEE